MQHMQEQARCIIENMLNTGASLSKSTERLNRAAQQSSGKSSNTGKKTRYPKSTRKNSVAIERNASRRICARSRLKIVPIDVSTAEFREYNVLITQCGLQGQSIHHIMESNKDIFQKCKRTIYNYFNQGLFSLPRGEMPRVCMRKEKKQAKIRHKVDPQYRTGRTLSDFGAMPQTPLLVKI